jgi:hypothetical protein
MENPPCGKLDGRKSSDWKIRMENPPCKRTPCKQKILMENLRDDWKI